MTIKNFLNPIFFITFFLLTLNQSYSAPKYALTLYGDPRYEEGFDHFVYANPNAFQGGTLSVAAVSNTYDTLNPFIVRGTSVEGIGLIYDTLMSSSLDESFTMYGLVAEKAEIAEDHKSITFYLNKQAQFHDGKDITSDDVKFSFETLTKHNPLQKSYYQDVERLEVIDHKTITFHFKTSTNRELPLILGQLTVLPKHYWKDRDFSKPTLDIPLGSGPYKISEANPGKNIFYEKVPTYWGKDLGVNKGHYNFDRIIVDYYRDRTVQKEAFKAGEYDVHFEGQSKAWSTEYNIPEVKNGLIVKEKIYDRMPAPMQGFYFNTRKDIFKNRKTRQAIAEVFDFEWTNKNLFYNIYQRTDSWWDNSELASSGLPSQEELNLLTPHKDNLPPELFTESFAPSKTDGSGRVRNNLRKAKALLKEAGWIYKNGKFHDPETDKPLAFEMLIREAVFEKIVLPYKRNLDKLGVTMNIRRVDTSQWVERLNKFDFDCVIAGISQSLNPGNELYSYFGSQSADTIGSNNIIGIKNPVIDDLIQRILLSKTRTEVVQATKALDRVLLFNHYVIPQWNNAFSPTLYWNKFDHLTPPIKSRMNQSIPPFLLTWWIDPEKEKKLVQLKKNLKSSSYKEKKK